MRTSRLRRITQVGVAVAVAALALAVGPLPAAHAATDFTLDTTSLDYGTVGLGLDTTLDIRITNATLVGQPVDPVVSPGTLPVSIVDDCGEFGIASGASCTLQVTVHPTSPGLFSGDIGLTLAGVPYPVTVSGNAILPFTVTSPLAFGEVGLGVPVTMDLTITNALLKGLELDLVADFPPGSPWAVVDDPLHPNTCALALALAAQAYCTLPVTFTPTTLGAVSNDTWLSLHGLDYTTNLTGTGVPALVLTPSSLAFGSLLVGTSSLAQTLQVLNNAGRPLTLTTLTAGFPAGAPFTVTAPLNGSCPLQGETYVLATGAFCLLDVTFSPSAGGPASSSLNLDLFGHRYSVPVSGTGTLPPATCTADFRAPLTDGTNLVQRGRVLPVKLSVACGANGIGTAPSIRLVTGDQTGGQDDGITSIPTSSSAADTTGVMRPIDGGFIYNLQVPSTLVVGNEYTIKVSTGDYDVRVLLKIKR